MQDEPCPTCKNPLGASLKALREERDRLIPFVAQHRPKRDEFLRLERDLKNRSAEFEKAEEALRLRTEKLEGDETALVELMNAAQRPEQEFDQLKHENQVLREGVEALVGENQKSATEAQTSLESLRQKLASETKKRKETEKEAALARGELSALAETNHTLTRDLASLQAKFARESELLASARDAASSLKRENKELQQQHRNLLRENKELLGRMVDSDRKVESLSNINSQLKATIQDLSKLYEPEKPASFSITDIELVEALSQEVSQIFLPPAEVVSLGSGPLDESEFDTYLQSLRITPCANGCPWIIVGREDWSEDTLNELLDDADLDEVRVFSQELFIAGILSTHDPFSLPIEILMKFAEGHPALEYLIQSSFEWPEVVLEKDYGTPVYLKGSWERVEESPLYRMGYQVGITHGQPRSTRKSLLKKAYQGTIPAVEDDDYMEEWGNPGRSKRLWRIAHHIAWLIHSRKRIPSMRHAVKDWQDDLDWMEEQFYTNRMRFQWPNG